MWVSRRVRGVRTVREATYDLFRRHGMTTMFGNPGSTELPMLADFPDDFRYVLGLQEAVAVGMADGYAQASGTVGHVNLHTAPGVGNGMGAIFNAQANHTPLLVTAGQQARELITLQANLTNRDAARMPHPLVKSSYEPPRAADVPLALARAIHLANTPAKGPAFVSVPMDDWDAEVSDAEADAAIDRSVSASSGPDPDAMTALARKLDAAASPVFVAGPDIDAAGAWEAAVALVERLNLPVFAIPAPGGGRLGFPEGHPNFRGILPPAIGPLAETLKGRDLILVAGSSVFPYYPNIPGDLLPEGATLVQITSDPDEAARAPMGNAILGDVKLALLHLLGAVAEADRDAGESLPEPVPGDEADPITGTAAMNALREAFPDDGIVVLEAPSATLALRNQLRISRPGQLLLRRRRRARVRARGRRRGPARAARPTGRLRRRGGVGAVRDHGALERGRVLGAAHGPRPAQLRVRDPQVVRRHRGRRRRPRPGPPLAELHRGVRGLRRGGTRGHGRP